MKRLQVQADNKIDTLEELIEKYSDDIIEFTDLDSDVEEEPYSPEDIDYYNGHTPAHGGYIETSGYFVFTINLNQLEKTIDRIFTSEEIDEYITKIKTCKKPNDLEEYITIDGYEAAEFSSNKNYGNSSDDEIDAKSVTVNNKIITLKFEFKFDGPYKDEDDDGQDY